MNGAGGLLPLAGLTVVDFSDAPTGAHATQLFADFGAEVIQVERPGGSRMRSAPSYPFLGRGKKSIVLDLHDHGDLASAIGLASEADVVIETFRPGTAERLGLGYAELFSVNPRLVYGSVTGFGRTGPLSRVKGYEGTVMAKMGAMSSLSEMSSRPGPSFPSAPYCAFPAAQLLTQGVLAALYEREQSGLGQRVETTLVQGLSVHDTFNWFSRVIGTRYGSAFVQVPVSVAGVPTSGLSFRLLIALTKDGHWVQFSQTAERLFRAMMQAFDLDWMFTDSKWMSAPDFADVDTRVEFWERLLMAVRSKTLAEWIAVFDEHPDVWAERFRHGSEVLDHPQVEWNGTPVTIHDHARGDIRQPGRIVKIATGLAPLAASAPGLDADRDGVLDRLRDAARSGELPAATTRPVREPSGSDRTGRRPPLEGITLLELGTYYAAPFGATLLAELGARVIKVEQLDGDPMRNMLPFPEIAGVKALQGKESLAVDITTSEGRKIVYELAAGADIVLQSFRAGVAERLEVDGLALRRHNPDLVYLNAPGYGTGGPNGHRPAYAPTIGAAGGLAWRNAGTTIPEGDGLTLDEVKRSAMPLAQAVMGVGNCDGLASVTVGTALVLGLLVRRRSGMCPELTTTMLDTVTHALCDETVSFDGAPDAPTADAGLHGLSALYRLYRASDGWVFLAAPSEREWDALAPILTPDGRLGADRRFATERSRGDNDTELAEDIARVMVTRSASDWEDALGTVDVACSAVAPGPVEANFMDDGSVGALCGLVTSAWHPTLDDHPRLTPLVTMSESPGVAAGGCLTGQHTATVLTELGYGPDQIDELRSRRIIGV
ncbi:CoA transferase [Acidiferrimicrobium sp. IK]|uniref:CaiB/BaiF CoA transferase family protein n=1 Tax=Acidiferrimicrobium sp. IK TaxID=2871700 RepID=UPI0021CB10EE|nr:CoA transferase [Acidiferrimicrobium sp. IK]MCU4184057.1 CoA transferase [Acidiferrimicrobium sp. IK]